MNKLNCRRTKDVSTIRSDTLRFLMEMIEDTHQVEKLKNCLEMPQQHILYPKVLTDVIAES